MAAKVLVVARTRIRGGICVGGLALETGRNLRLLEQGRTGVGDGEVLGGYRVGELWEIEYVVPTDLVPPHLEDILVTGAERIGHVEDPVGFLRERVRPWEGPPERLFDGLLQPTDGASGYISERNGIPGASVGFWLPDQPLHLEKGLEGPPRYRYPGPHGVRSIPYVGTVPPIEVLPAEGLLRVSLARWWQNPDTPGQEPRCYLQLSGWFGV